MIQLSISPCHDASALNVPKGPDSAAQNQHEFSSGYQGLQEQGLISTSSHFSAPRARENRRGRQREKLFTRFIFWPTERFALNCHGTYVTISTQSCHLHMPPHFNCSASVWSRWQKGAWGKRRERKRMSSLIAEWVLPLPEFATRQKNTRAFAGPSDAEPSAVHSDTLVLQERAVLYHHTRLMWPKDGIHPRASVCSGLIHWSQFALLLRTYKG